MFILLLILMLFLPGAVLPLALEANFSSDEMMEMGVYLEDIQSVPASERDQVNRSQKGHLRPCASLSS